MRYLTIFLVLIILLFPPVLALCLPRTISPPGISGAYGGSGDEIYITRLDIKDGKVTEVGLEEHLVGVLAAEKELTKYIPKDEWINGHHLFLLFGRYYCKAISPSCDACRLNKYCKIKRKCD